MEHITIGQIASAIGVISVIGGFVATIIMSISKWYKNKITDKIAVIEIRIDDIEEYLEFLKTKKEQYEKIAQDSKDERILLLEGLLACLEGLKQKGENDSVTRIIKKINSFLLDKLHD